MALREMHIQGQGVVPVVKALSNDVRLKILDYCDEEMTVQELTSLLGLTKTAVLAHLKILEEAGFIMTRYVPGMVGNQKVCKKMYDRLIFDFAQVSREENHSYYQTITPPGNYFDFELYPPCGLATASHVIKKWDDPSVFILPERVEATILWCVFGFVEYRIPLNIPFEEYGLSKIEIMLELSAQGSVSENKSLVLPEAVPFERLTDGISDVFFQVDGREIGTCTVEECSRGQGGKYTPTWWKGSNYGKIITITIDESGSYINGTQTSDIRVYDIFTPDILTRDTSLKRALHSADNIRFRVGIHPNAKHISGFNIYGHGFGHYPIDIITRYYIQ